MMYRRDVLYTSRIIHNPIVRAREKKKQKTRKDRGGKEEKAGRKEGERKQSRISRGIIGPSAQSSRCFSASECLDNIDRRRLRYQEKARVAGADR